MAAYTSTQSGNFNSASTWGGAGWPNLDGDTFTVAAGHVVTYNLTTPLNTGLGSSVVNSGGTFIMDTNTVIRFDGASTYTFACNGNLIIRPGAKTLLKGTTASDRVYDIRPLTFIPTTATGTSGQNTITVASNVSQIYVGNKVSGTGIATGAYVTSIAGNVLTLSANNTGTVSGNLTVGNYVEINGSDPMPITTISSAITTSQYQQGFVSVASASNFVTGDWIAVYERGVVDALADRNDEGFIVHEVSGNNIYLREFVGPSTTISSYTTNTITVANAKIFRTWQKLIFGTGAGRNIAGITSINYETNVITLSSNVVGNPTGLTVYTTGPLQTKAVGDKVTKMATTVASDAPSNSTTITLSSAAGLNVGDEVIVASLWTSSQSSYTDEQPEKRNITAINSNTITLNSSLGYIAYAGAFVTKTNRDIRFVGDYEITLTLSAAQSFAAGDIITQAYSGAKGVVKTATTSSTTVVIHDIFGVFITGTTNSPWLSKNGTPIATNVSCTTVAISTTQGHCGFGFARSGAFTSNLLPVLYFRNVEVATFSNTNSTSSYFWVRGYWSTHTSSVGGVELEGISYSKPNQGDNFNYQLNSIIIQRYFRDITVRNCVVWNSIYGIYFNEGYDLYNGGCFNNFVARSEVYGLYWQHMDNAGTGAGGACEAAYNYIHRIDDAGILYGQVRAPGRGVHHNWVDVCQVRGVYFDWTYTQGMLYQNRIRHYFEPAVTIASNEHNLIYNEWTPASELYDFYIDTSFLRSNQSVSFTTSVVSLEHNYEYDGCAIFIPGGMRVWDNAERAWRCTFDNDIGAVDVGSPEVFYIPANATLTVDATIKLAPTFAGTVPKLEVRGSMDRFYAGTNGAFAGAQPFRGYVESINFDLQTDSYQTKQIVFTPRPWGRTVTAGVINVNSNAFIGWWEKPIQVKIDGVTPEAMIYTGYNKFSANVLFDTTAATKQVRLGGRII